MPRQGQLRKAGCQWAVDTGRRRYWQVLLVVAGRYDYADQATMELGNIHVHHKCVHDMAATLTQGEIVVRARLHAKQLGVGSQSVRQLNSM